MWTTETHTLFGAYDMTDYGCSRPQGYPVSIETSGYLHVVRHDELFTTMSSS